MAGHAAPSAHPPADTLAGLLPRAAQRLAAALALDRATARIEARVLCAHALGVDAAWLLAHDLDPLFADQAEAIEHLIARRERGEPVAYLTGTREFHGRTFAVTPDVLIPRPETELLVDVALQLAPADRPMRVLDIGTGSGIIAITLALERPRWQVSALDVSAPALTLAQANAARLGAPVRFLLSDLFANVGEATFDLIVGNPPYVAEDDPHLGLGDLRFEPLDALRAGKDGLATLQHIIDAAHSRLTAGGWLLLEHGSAQGPAVQRLLMHHGYRQVDTWADIAGLDRVSGGRSAVA